MSEKKPFEDFYKHLIGDNSAPDYYLVNCDGVYPQVELHMELVDGKHTGYYLFNQTAKFSKAYLDRYPELFEKIIIPKK